MTTRTTLETSAKKNVKPRGTALDADLSQRLCSAIKSNRALVVQELERDGMDRHTALGATLVLAENPSHRWLEHRRAAFVRVAKRFNKSGDMTLDIKRRRGLPVEPAAVPAPPVQAIAPPAPRQDGAYIEDTLRCLTEAVAGLNNTVNHLLNHLPNLTSSAHLPAKLDALPAPKKGRTEVVYVRKTPPPSQDRQEFVRQEIRGLVSRAAKVAVKKHGASEPCAEGSVYNWAYRELMTRTGVNVRELAHVERNGKSGKPSALDIVERKGLLPALLEILKTQWSDCT